MHGPRKKYSCLLTSKFPKSDMASVSLLSLLLLDGCNQTINKVIYKCVLSFLNCKTVRIFAYSSTREQSNKRSGTRLKTESETGERR